MALNSNTELSLINTNINAGTITLPATSTSQGRVISFKDIVGSFNRNSLTLQCSGADTFEDGGTRKVLRESYGSIQLVASGTKWYILNGTQVNTLQTVNFNVNAISSITISTTNTTISSLTFLDNLNSTNSFYTTISSVSTQAVSTNFLYYNDYIIAGTRVGYSSLLNRTRFSLFSLPGLSLWLDSADLSSISFSSGSNVSQWRDKTINFNNATPTGSITYDSINRSMNLTAGGRFSGAIRIEGYTGSGIGLSFFAVATVRSVYSGGANSRLVQFTDGTNIDFNSPSAVAYSMNSTGLMQINRNLQFVSLASVLAVNQFFITSCVANISGNTLINVNGATSGGLFASNTTTTTTNSMTRYFIGGGVQFGDSWTGSVNEVIVCSASLSEIQRQQVEGYLAWKWSLQAQLPASHPYKNAPPS